MTYTSAFRTILIGVLLTGLLVGASASGSVALAADSPADIETSQPDASVEAQSGINVSLVPADQTVDAGTTTEYEIVVTGATDGIDAYELILDLSNASVGTIESYEHEQTPGADGAEIRENGSQLFIEAAMLGNPIAGAETITLGTLTVAGDTDGETALDQSDIQISQDGTPYDITSVSNGSLTVEGEITDPALSLSVANGSIDEGEQTELNVVASDIKNGVSMFNITIDPVTADVINTSNVTVAGDDSPVITETDSGGLQIEAEPARGNGDLTLATVELTGAAPGETDLNLTDVSVVDQDGAAYTPRSVTNTAITVEGAGTSVDIDLRATDTEVPVNSTTAVDVVLEGPGSGVNAFALNVTLENTTASIVDYEYNKQPDFDNTAVAADGNSIQLSAGMGGNTYSPADEIRVVTVIIETNAPGAVQLNVAADGVRIDDTDGNTYETGALSGATFDVVAGPPPVAGENAPQDLDNDGTYEDIDGDGDFTIFDVQALFQNLNAEEVQNNPNAFNFDDAEDPDSVTIFDVQALLTQLAEQKSG